MTAHWYAICSKPHKEEVLWEQLSALGFEVFYPHFLLQTDRMDSIKAKPYFPGYLFVNTDIDVVGVSTFQWMPYATGLVCFGGKPAWVPETLIEAIQKRIQKINVPAIELLDVVEKSGNHSGRQEMRSGYEIMFDPGMPGKERVQALLSILDEMNVSPEKDKTQV